MTSTGPVETWKGDPLDLGPLYPFVGYELLMFGVCAFICLAFLVWKVISENEKYKRQASKIRQGAGRHGQT